MKFGVDFIAHFIDNNYYLYEAEFWYANSQNCMNDKENNFLCEILVPNLVNIHIFCKVWTGFNMDVGSNFIAQSGQNIP